MSLVLSSIELSVGSKCVGFFFSFILSCFQPQNALDPFPHTTVEFLPTVVHDSS